MKASRRAKQSTAAEPVRFEERLSFMIHRLHASLAQVAGRLLRANDLDPVSSRILVLLIERGDMRVGELVEMLVLPQSTVSHQLQRLERAGLIIRQRPADDSRSVVVTLTARGKVIGGECNELSLLVHERMVQDLTADEVEALQALLRRVFRSLDMLRAAPPDRGAQPGEGL